MEKRQLQKEEFIDKKKETNIRNIYRTLEQNEYIKEKKKQEWL